MAAGLLFVTLVILLWGPDDPNALQRPRRTPTIDPFIAKLFDRDVRLAAARTPLARLEILTDMADDLQGQTRAAARAADADDLTKLAALYERVLSDGVLIGARKLTAEQRRQALAPIADRLARIGTESDQLAEKLPDTAAAALRQIAAVSRQADDQLRTFVREAAS
jgi:hypothetical protein